MIKKEILDNCLVVTFSTGERTEGLSDFCFAKLGFKNRLIFSDASGLREKFFKLAELANSDKQYDFFIQNDADRLVFDGVYKLITNAIEKNIDSSAGFGFDYLMNRMRGATPNFFSKRTLLFLKDNPQIMPNVQKPLTAWGMAMKKSGNFVDTDYDALTNLHDFEQAPSKVCNTILNRLTRNHFHLYDKNHLNNLPDCHKTAVQHAIDLFNQGTRKETIDYIDFSFLDESVIPIPETEYETLYNKYKSIYEKHRGNK